MAIYNPKSLKAEEFIHDQEILDTIAYAEANKRNVELIDAISTRRARAKAAMASPARGLTTARRRCCSLATSPDKIEEMYKLANWIKLAFYGNRIVMFAPLYLSNYCVNGCVYCPYHLKKQAHRPQKAHAGRGARRGHRIAGHGA